MRTTWVLMGILGASAIAAASPTVQFYTVINQGDSIAGDQFSSSSQVVVGDGGDVAIIGQLENSGNNVVIYSTPIAGNMWSSQTVLEEDTPTNVNGLAAGQLYFNPNNLALSSNPSGGTRLTFGIESYNNTALTGFFQWDDNSNVTSLGDVAFDGDGKGYSNVGAGTDSGGATLEMQVNGSGHVLFPAVASSKDVLARGDVSGVTTVFTSGNASLAIGDPGSRVALGADDSGAALLNASGTNGIYSIPAIAGTPTKLSGSFTPVALDPLMGYASGNGINAALMLVKGTNTGSQNVVLEKNGGTPQSILANQFTPASNTLSPAQGEMTPNGQVALYIPDPTNGDTIQHANAAALNSNASVIASVAGSLQAAADPSTSIALDPTATNLDIQALQDPAGSTPWVPQINSGGTIVFNAEIGNSPSTEKEALLDWQPGDASPTVLLAVGDTVVIDGTPETISDFSLNSLEEENDYYKNAISDDGYLAVGVTYDDDNDSAVLITQLPTAAVPEPATLTLLSIAGFGLLARRRR
jgi:hypothetical protein